MMKLFYLSTLFFILSCNGVAIQKPKSPQKNSLERPGFNPLGNMENPSLPEDTGSEEFEPSIPEAEPGITPEVGFGITPETPSEEGLELHTEPARLPVERPVVESAEKFYVFNNTKYLVRVEYDEAISTIEPYSCVPLVSVSLLDDFQLHKISVVLPKKELEACAKSCPGYFDDTGLRTLEVNVKGSGILWTNKYSILNPLQIVHSSCGGSVTSSQ